jgi:hypothetical protein
LPLRRTIVLILIALGAAATAGLGVVRAVGDATGVRTPSASVVAQARVDALADIAKRLYFQEVYGEPNASAFRRLSVRPGLVRGLETGDLVLARRTLNHVVVRHAVRERVTHGSRTLVDVGLKFVIAGERHPLRAPDGTYLGRIEISIQDVIGFVKLFHRLTGADVVVRGWAGHAKSSLAAPGRLPPLPSSGPVSVAGRAYFVSSFARTGFAGEPLTVWILDPVGGG